MKNSRASRALLVAPLALAGLLLGGCAASQPSGSPTDTAGTGGGTINVVASTDVWGSVASAVGGDHVKVVSIIDDPDKDPHEYQADAQNQLAISKAQLVIENGGGYDDFIGQMVGAVSNAPDLLNVADISGYDQNPAEGEFNEHLWYDFPTVEKVVDKIADAYSTADPGDAADFTANAKTFVDHLHELESTEADLKGRFAGQGVAITEPVPLYMLNAIGLDNKTPSDFSESIEEDTDVAPAVLKQTLDLFSKKQVKLLAYNEQTTGPETEAVLKAAKDNGIAVVPVTETLPAGEDYLSWMTKNLAAIGDALGK